MKFAKIISLIATRIFFAGCFETKKDLVCDNKNVQETIKKQPQI